jgi:hypothetical protein
MTSKPLKPYDPIQFKFVLHDNRRGYSYPVTPETVYATLGAEKFYDMTEKARHQGTHKVKRRGDTWVAVRYIN